MSNNEKVKKYLSEHEKINKFLHNKKALIISGAVLLAIIVLILCLVLIKKPEEKTVAQKVENVVGLGYGTNRYSGVVETQKTEEIKYDSTKKISEVYVEVGSQVKAGDKLFSYDVQSINLEIQKEQAEIEFANSNIANYNEQIIEIRNNMSGASPAQQMALSAQIQQLQADIAQAELDIKTKQAEIDAKQASIKKAVVTSSITGTVQKIMDLENGTLGDGENQNDVFMSIIGEGGFRIKGSIGEQNIYEITEETPVIVRSRIDETKIWNGKVTSIINQQTEENPQGESVNLGETSSKYTFYVELKDTKDLMLGQHVTIEIDTTEGQSQSGLWLNMGWIKFDGEDAYVYAASSKNQKPTLRKISVGKYNEEIGEYEILSGLKLSDYIAWPEDVE